MKTSKPISTISFNSLGFLSDKLAELVNAKIIEFWAYIPHVPEPKDDDGNGKEHSHVYVIPAKQLQTVDLRDMFLEFDPIHPKPLGCLPFQNSKFDDWYMYGLHDRNYLSYKGLTRQFHYSAKDVVTSDVDALNYFVRQIDLTSISPVAAMVEAMGMGLTFQEFFKMGKVPVQQINQWSSAWDMLYNSAFKSKSE